MVVEGSYPQVEEDEDEDEFEDYEAQLNQFDSSNSSSYNHDWFAKLNLIIN